MAKCQVCFRIIQDLGYIFKDKKTQMTKMTCYDCYLSLRKNRQYILIFRGIKIDKVLGRSKKGLMPAY